MPPVEILSTGGVFLNRKRIGFSIAGFSAGAVNGLFGAGGGMVLVPLLTLLTKLEDSKIFPASIGIILPVCIVSLLFTAMVQDIPWTTAFPYLIGSSLGGLASGLWGQRIPVSWLHRGLGIMILWGGFRYLC